MGFLNLALVVFGCSELKAVVYPKIVIKKLNPSAVTLQNKMLFNLGLSHTDIRNVFH